MAKIQLNQARIKQFGGATPYGNCTTLPFTLTTNATGAAENSSSVAALAVNDTVNLGTLPAGMCLQDALIVVSETLTAAVTADLGFVYTDGVDDADVPQDTAYFGAALAMGTAARLRMATTKLVTLPKEAHLVLTVKGAANAKAGRVDCFIVGELTGSR